MAETRLYEAKTAAKSEFLLLLRTMMRTGEVNEEPAEAINIATLIGLVGDDRDRHRLLFATFVNTTREIIETIQAACQDRAVDVVGQQAHKLKSSARSMGADQLADVCWALETAAKNMRWDEIDEQFPRLDPLFESVKAYIDRYCESEVSGSTTDIACDTKVEDISILSIDDDKLILEVEKLMLKEMGISNIFTATTGKEALAFLDDHGSSIHLIMLDLNMPGMDGIAFLRHLATRNYDGSILLVSGQHRRILQTATRLAGEHRLKVLGFVEKPIKPVDVKHFLDKLKDVPLKEISKTGDFHQPAVTADELRSGIENNELVVFFQPKVNVLSRRVVGAEALVRWQHPEKGLIPPFVFISLAEENGLIDALTRRVFEQAVRHAAELQSSGFDIKVAVNLSVDNLYDLAWPDYAMAVTESAGVDPSKIVLEITETRLISNIALALEILVRLSMSKFILSIDDFGTGYSSMEQLQRIPFSELKVDRAFVHGAANENSAKAILESSVNLARKLDMSVVAEGVETEEDWNLIADIGCDQVQGYLIAKPMPVDEWVTWLREWNKRYGKEAVEG